MEEKKNGLIIIIVILTILVITLGGYLVYDKILSKDNNNPPINNVNSNTKEKDNILDNKQNSTPSLKELSNYFDDIHILETKLCRRTGDTVYNEKEVMLSKEQLIEILSSLSNSSLTKKYAGGLGDGQDYLVINYELNGQNHYFSMDDSRIMINNVSDDNIINILDKAVIEENNEYKNEIGAVQYYEINNFTSSIFDKYFD